MRRFEQPEQLPPDLRVTRTYLFAGGCVTYGFAFQGGNGPRPSCSRLISALAFESRGDLVAEVADRTDLSLCGAVAPPCSGSDP